MNRLVAFGCSNTFGHGLKDCHVPPDIPGETPSKFAWPGVLAARLKRKCVNRADVGLSNKEIWYRVLHTPLRQTDIVVISWTYLSRSCTFGPDGEVLNRIFVGSNEKCSKVFFKHFYDDFDMNLDANLRMHHAHKVLTEKGITNYHMVDNHEEFTRSKWNDTPLLESTITVARRFWPMALDNVHPGEGAHKNFANMIYDEIKEQP